MAIRKYHYFLLALLVIAGLIGGYFLIPGQHEMALMQYHSNQPENARANYEMLLSRGDLSADVVAPLAKIYLESGQADQAVQLLERFVQSTPTHIEARRLLGSYYLLAQKPRDYLKNLLVLEKLGSSAEQLREIARISRQVVDLQALAGALNNLSSRNEATPQESIELASLLAASGSLKEALSVLAAMQDRFPESFPSEALRLLFRLAWDTGQGPEAVRRAGDWLRQRPDVSLASELAALAAERGDSTGAYTLLQRFESSAESSPERLAQWISLQVSNGQGEAAYARLQALSRKDRLPDALKASLAELALDQGQPEIALQLAESGTVLQQSDRLTTRLALAAYRLNHNAQAAALMRRIPEAYLRSQPLLAAELFQSAGRNSEARAWARKVQQAGLPIEQKVQLAGIYMQLGMDREALGMLSVLGEKDRLPDSALGAVARVYLRSGKARQGLELFEQRRKSKPSQPAEEGWALLAATAGRTDLLSSWLSSAAASQAGSALLKDLYYTTAKAGQQELALRIARMIAKSDPGRREKLLLAEALGNAGKLDEALAMLRPMALAGTEESSSYHQMLLRARKAGIDVDDELRRAAVQQLSNPNLSRSQKEQWIQLCADLKDYQAILPFLPGLVREKGDQWLYPLLEASRGERAEKELIVFLKTDLQRPGLSYQARLMRLQALLDRGAGAESLAFLKEAALREQGSWAAAYVEILQKLDRQGEIREYLKTVSARAGLKEDEKRSIAFQLLSSGDKESAMALYQDLAKNQGPEGPDVKQLLYLWGPRPATAALDWLEARARSATGREKASWMNHLINAGGAERVIQLNAMKTSP